MAVKTTPKKTSRVRKREAQGGASTKSRKSATAPEGPAELLPSDQNDSEGISPRVAFLAYN